MAQLTIIEGPEKGRVITLSDHPLVIGRAPADQGLPIRDEAISRQHVQVNAAGAQYEIVDLGSSNGTRLNGHTVDRAFLTEGDVFTIGKSTFCFTRQADTFPCIDLMGDFESRMIPLETVRATLAHPDAAAPAQAPKRLSLENIYRCNQLFTSTLDQDRLYQHIVTVIQQFFPEADRVLVIRVDPADSDLETVAARSGPAAEAGEEPRYSSTLVRYALRQRQAALIQNPLSDQRFQAQASIRLQRAGATIVVPVEVAQQVTAVIYVDSMNPLQQFTEEDLRLMALIGIEAGAALQNARLYGQLMDERNALQEAMAKLQSAQEQLVQSEKMAALGQLVAGIVHDVRNPLTVISGHAQLLDMLIADSADPALLKESIRQIIEGVDHGNRIMSRLLQFAKPSPPSKKHVSLNPLLKDTVEFLQTEINKYQTVVQPLWAESLPPVEADENQLRQVFMNILMNALQAIGKNGKITICTRVVEDRGRRMVEAAITDTGCGMDQEVLARLFVPFFTTKKKSAAIGGMGLGLSVSYGIIRNHGGEILVESAPGQGTTFRVRLPVPAAAAPLNPPPAAD